MPHDAGDIAERLAANAEAVCRHYLANGRRQGRYWLTGDLGDTPGRSLYVRLTSADSMKAAGKWTDAATGEHGDLLDLIAARERLTRFVNVLDEAARFLALPPTEPRAHTPLAAVPTGSPEAARRLFAMATPLTGTMGARYLRSRGITTMPSAATLRFHPRCWYRPEPNEPVTNDAFPALIAAVTDEHGTITGAHRTWLAPDGSGKAPVASPRRAMGALLGHGVRYGQADDIIAIGEGIETMLSLRQAFPGFPAVAALSAAHLGAFLLSAALRRLYIARDPDPAGEQAAATLGTRAAEAGIEVRMLDATSGDLNDDLRALWADAFRQRLRVQLAGEDVERFSPDGQTGDSIAA